MSNIKWSWPVQVFCRQESSKQTFERTSYASLKSFSRLSSPTSISRGTASGQRVQKAPYRFTIAILDTPERVWEVKSDILIIPIAADQKGRFEPAIRTWANIQRITDHYLSSAVLFVNQAQLEIFLDQLIAGIGENEDFVKLTKRLQPIRNYWNAKLDWTKPLTKAYVSMRQRLDRLPTNRQVLFNARIGRDKIFQVKNFKTIIDQHTKLLNLDGQADLELLKEIGEAISKAEQNTWNSANSRSGFGQNSPNRTTMSFQKTIPDDFVEDEEEEDTDRDWLEEEHLRFLQCGIVKAHSDEPVLTTLQPDEAYLAKIRIGSGGESFISADQVFQEEGLFKDDSTLEEEIFIHFQPEGGTIQQRSLFLPRLGNSQTVDFDFRAPSESPLFKADIKAFHQNRLIQWVKLTASVAQDETGKLEPMTLIVIDAPRKDIRNLSTRSSFAASIVVEDQGAEVDITGINQNQPLRINSSEGVKNVIGNIRNSVSSAAKNSIDFPEDIHHESNQSIFIKLATQGSLLYTRLFQDKAIGSPIQICSDRADFLPIGFVYELPPPAMGATMCSNATEALKAGKCMECFDKSEHPSPHICPFGFWGFSRVIEFHRSPPAGIDFNGGDFLVSNEPNANRSQLEVFKQAIHGSVGRMEFGTVGLRKALYKKLQSLSPCEMAENWQDWEDITSAQEPDTIILIVHVEKDEDFDVDKMEISDGQFLVQTHLSKKHIAQQVNPIAIVIGCEVANVSNQGFDVGSEFMQKGASIVITNFTKIIGPQAAKIVTCLAEFFHEHKGKEVNFGDIMLKAKQKLLSDGLIVGMSLVSYGDADWKLKI